VAKCADSIQDPRRRELLFFLHWVSWQPGGLAKLASDLIAIYPERVATRSMQSYGVAPGRMYDAAQVRKVRDELQFDHSPGFKNGFPVKGEAIKPFFNAHAIDAEAWYAHQLEESRRTAETLPDSYPAVRFSELCHKAASAKLLEKINVLCLDSRAVNDESPWYFPTLIETLCDYQSAWLEKKRAGQVITSIGRIVGDTLEYALQGSCLVLIDGLARTGKTFAAKNWVELNPGRARYVQVPSTGDDVAFFRAIAEAIGTSSALSLKNAQLRGGIEKALQAAKLLVVFDEAHYLWPQSNRREALPSRIAWILTALVNHGVPVALVTTPQFHVSQKLLTRNTGWASEQFDGRIGCYEKLPDSLTLEDFSAVARHLLPEGDKATITNLARYARNSTRYLAAIDSAVTRARYLAGKAGRKIVIADDVRNAIVKNVIPSDTAIVAAREQADAIMRGKGKGRARAIAPAPRATRAPDPAPERRDGRALDAAPARPVRSEILSPKSDRDNLTEIQPVADDFRRESLETV